MKKATSSILFLVIIFLISCGNPTVPIKDVEDATLVSVKAEFKKKKLNYEIIDLTLVHKTGNEYSGILKVKSWGSEQSLPIEVVNDEKNLVWQIK